MSKGTIIGIVILLLGFGMFVFGVAMFSYNGPGVSPFVGELGKYSFLYWFPTIIIGAVITHIGLRESRRNRSHSK